jgi:hypothetical protein
MHVMTQTTTEINGDALKWLEKLAAARIAKKQNELEEKDALEALRQASGGAEVLMFEGRRVAFDGRQRQRRIDSTLLRGLYPDIAEAVTVEIEFRKFILAEAP